jgi:energy-coupling factor transport system substrate-specific component
MGEGKVLSIRTIVAIGIGSAVFVILGRFGSIPSGVPDTNIETTYAFLALMAIIYGPIAGVLIGFIGHTLKDAIFYGSPWFSWIIASAVVGLIIGLAAKRINIQSGVFGKREFIRFNIYQIIANALAWFVVAPILDVLMYAEPLDKIYAQSLVAGFANIVTVAIIGSLLAAAYAKTRTKQGSLTKDM